LALDLKVDWRVGARYVAIVLSLHPEFYRVGLAHGCGWYAIIVPLLEAGLARGLLEVHLSDG
jgi:hypothetical protein